MNIFLHDPPPAPFLRETIEITHDLIANLPYYLQQVAPGGWEDTVYKKWVDKRLLQHDDIVFLRCGREPEQDLFRLLAQALEDVTRFSQIVHRDTGQHFSIDIQAIAQALSVTQQQVGMDYDATTLWDDPYWDPDRFPLYEIVLKAIQNRGHGWYYVDPALYALATELGEFRDEQIDPVANSLHPMVIHVKRQVASLLEDAFPGGDFGDVDLFDFENVFNAFHRAPPPPAVQLYRRVCGESPQGYPYSYLFYLLVYSGELE